MDLTAQWPVLHFYIFFLNIQINRYIWTFILQDTIQSKNFNNVFTGHDRKCASILIFAE